MRSMTSPHCPARRWRNRLIDGYQGVLSYRGFNIHTLADHAIFEEVIFLLWNGWLPKQRELDQLKNDLAAERSLPGPVIDFLKSAGQGNGMDVLRTAVSMLSLYDSEAQDMSTDANHRKAVRLMSKTATIVTALGRLRQDQPLIESDPQLGFSAIRLCAAPLARRAEVVKLVIQTRVPPDLVCARQLGLDPLSPGEVPVTVARTHRRRLAALDQQGFGVLPDGLQ